MERRADTDKGSTTNSLALLERFVDRLLARRPRNVLDVGCGHGPLLERCRQRGVPALGVEPSARALQTVRAARLRAVCGSAGALPVDDGSFDWVTLRHVAHHLRDPRAAIAEALRVARVGVMLAEPWFDRSLPSQELAWRADCWAKRQDRRHGHEHHENLDVGDVLAAVPAPLHDGVEIERYLCLLPQPWEEFWAKSGPSVDGLPEGDDEVRAARELERECAERPMTANGTLIVTISAART